MLKSTTEPFLLSSARFPAVAAKRSQPLTLGGAPAGLCCGQARTASERIKTRDIHKCATALREILM